MKSKNTDLEPVLIDFIPNKIRLKVSKNYLFCIFKKTQKQVRIYF